MLSKWCCVLTVICLSVILLSLDADAQPTVDDETMTCGSAVSDEVVSMFKRIAANQQETASDVKKLLTSNPVECEHGTAQLSKEALVLALVCKNLFCF